MLDAQTINKIEEFVYQKPRNIQEIAQLLEENWRTADRYIEEIEKNFGTLSTRVFRGGTRGALKIVYWASVEKVSPSIFQEKLEKDICNFKKKDDFSAFDIFQYVPDNKRECFVFNNEEENLKDFISILLKAKKQILFFSGNLSFINLKGVFETLEKIISSNVQLKILCRVDLAGKKNLEKVLSLNTTQGKKTVEIRHDAHPIRGFVVDGIFVRLKEVKEPTGKIDELNRKKFIFYNISEKTWAEWMSRIFWKKFSNSMDANRRLENLKRIKL